MHTQPHSGPPTLYQDTADPRLCRRLLDTHGQIWVSLLWGQCSFLLGPGAHKVLFMPSQSLFSQSCVSKFWWLHCGVNGDILQEGLCHTRVCCTQSPYPSSRLLLTHTSARDAQTLRGRSGSLSVESPGVHKVLFEPSEHLWWLWGLILTERLWQVWGLILNVIFPLLPSCGDFSFAFGCGVYFFLWDPTFFCRWLFSSELLFWSSHRRWVHILLSTVFDLC